MKQSEAGYSYLIKIKIGPKNFSMLIRNYKEIPNKIIETMIKEKISKYINDTYLTYKHYRSQTSDAYYNKMIKESSYEIEDLNEIEVFDLQLNFNKDETIINKENGKEEIKQSSINSLDNA